MAAVARSTAYHDLLRHRGVSAQALAGLLAQTTQGAAGVGIILVVHEQTGSLALAGAVVGGLSMAAGAARPVQGRVIDRRGARALMAACGFAHPAALVGIVALANLHAPGAWLVALGVAAGLALPPVSTTMRVIWGGAVPESERTAAYSLVYLTQQLSILTGPLVLAAFIAATNASLAMVAVAVLAGAGTLAYALLIPARLEPRPLRSARPNGAVLRAPGMPTVLGIAALIGATIGALEVGIPTFATAHHAPATSGLLIAALSAGGIAGAALYGSRRWSAPPTSRLVVILAALTAALLVTISAPTLLVLGILLLAAGLPLNPSLTTISLIVDQRVSPASVAEAFGWLSAGIAGGTGAANALAGGVTTAGHPRDAFVIAAVAGALAALLAAIAWQADRRAGDCSASA